jgi:hypothetical protein
MLVFVFNQKKSTLFAFSDERDTNDDANGGGQSTEAPGVGNERFSSLHVSSAR